MKKNGSCVGLAAFLPLFAAAPASATFHFMQIEQVIGGVNGDTTAQAIQLRMRSAGQNQMQFSRVRVFDATGANPIMIVDMATTVPSGSAGRRVLIASSNFASYTSPAAAPDFIMTNLIPPSYLAAGSLTFEQDNGTILWRLSWGGAAYTGSHTGSITNDADGNFGPGVPFALPSTSLQAVVFTGASNALSTNNAAQYVVTAGAATFTNNATATFLVQNAVCATTLGDTNSDNCQSAADIQRLVDCLVGGGHVGTTTCACSDSDGNAMLDLFDLDDLVNDLLNPTSPCP